MSRLLEHCRPGAWPEHSAARMAAHIHDLHRKGPQPDPDAPECLRGGGRGWRGLALIGLADDEGVRLNGGRVGARHGPDAFRAALARYGAADSVGLSGLQALIFDCGNVEPGDDLDQTHARVQATVAAAIAADLMPIGIGGGHDLSLPEVRALAAGVARPAGRALHGVYFDAHLDVRPEAGSGMAFRRLLQERTVATLALFGMDPLSNSREHLDWFLGHGGTLAGWPADQWPSAECRFVSVCLDVVDMAQAPGVSAPAPAGWPAARLAAYAEAAGRQPSVCGFDLMELCPPHDENGRTARLAAHLFLRFLAGLARRPEPDAH